MEAVKVVGSGLSMQAEGIQGQTYTIPVATTKNTPLPMDRLAIGIRRFLLYAAGHPDTQFQITRLGQDVGYAPQHIMPFFRFAPPNCQLPADWPREANYQYRLLIAGSRNFDNTTLMENKLDHLLSALDESQMCLISGTAPGADQMGEKWAAQHDIPVVPFPAPWDDLTAPHARIRHNFRGKYNAVAGHNRNAMMLVACTHAVLFWDGKSPGTTSMKKMLANADVPTRIVSTILPKDVQSHIEYAAPGVSP